MPELKDVIKNVESTTVTDIDTNVVNVTTIDSNPTDLPNDLPKTAAPIKKTPPVKKAATTSATKPATNKNSATTTNSAPITTTETDVNTDAENEPNLRRPPMEQLTKDFERHVLSLEIVGQPIKKLEYKCGKVIFGINNESGKDFRVIAYKARKKSKTVAGKSRCIFFFGIHSDVQNLVKQFTGTSTTEFGKCSVQCKKPIQLILDKQTFFDHFNQDIEVVITTLKQLATKTIEQKTEQWKAFQEKIAAKAAKETETQKTAGSE